MQILLCIIRKTWGFQKREDGIALTQFVKATGLKKPAICRAISSLEEKRLIVIKNDNGMVKKYRVNKHFETWKPLSKKKTLSKLITNVNEKDNPPLSILSTTKDTSTKNTFTKDRPSRACPIASDFKVSPEMRAWFSEQGFKHIEIDSETAIFIDYWTGRGKPMKDWTSTWRNWMRRADRWAADNRKKQNAREGWI